ncbi:MAG: 3-hydroxyacyl-CoA dehydrogenase NAD-binding domain-containing protein [Bacteroidia bacterium]
MLDKNALIGIVGAGAMGAGIAQVAATAGHNVLVFDMNNAAIEDAAINWKSSINKLAEKNKFSREKVHAILANLKTTTDLSDFNGCNLIIEAVIEDISIKQKIFLDLEKMVSDQCVLATNTSSLSIASIASVCKIPSRVIGIHFFNPAIIMPLVEIIPAITTHEKIIDSCKEMIDFWGKTTVVAKDTPGFIVNRLARCFYGESIRIYEEGIADFATIDWALKHFGQFRMGPFELMDFIGNDVNYKVTETVWTQFFYEPRFKPSITQRRLYEAKHYGRKTGKGYYDYSENTKQPVPNKNEILGKVIFTRVISMMINEAIEAFHQRLASKEDMEIAMEKGVNYPKGLFRWADDLGLENVLQTLTDLYTEYGEERYRPAVLLKRMVREGKHFYEKSFWHKQK